MSDSIISKPFDERNMPSPYLPNHPDWVELHDAAWHLAHKRICYRPSLTSPFYMNEGFSLDRIWQWDTCFIALYASYAKDAFPSVEMLDNFYTWQAEDGFISMCHSLIDGAPVFGERANPPLFSWMEWSYAEISGDTNRFERVLGPLDRYYRWLKRHRQRPEVAVPGDETPNSELYEDSNLYWETSNGAMGVDNSPRGWSRSWTGSEMIWLDMTCYQALNAKHLLRISEYIGDETLSEFYKIEHQNISAAIERWLWSDNTSFYHDSYLDGNLLATKTFAGFLPLVSESSSPERASCLMHHLLDSSKFWRKHPIASLSADDPNFDPSGKYWLGGVWAPVNALILHGLQIYGYSNIAHQIARKHVGAMYEVFKTTNTIWEAYAPDNFLPATDKSGKALVRRDFTGWSALGPIFFLYQYIIGLKPEGTIRKLTWTIHLLEPHGIARYPFLGNHLDIRSSGRKDVNEKVTIQLVSPIEFNLQINVCGRSLSMVVTPGEHQFCV